jgi:2-polyprenyl-3-methyl-5-hydroxy-6-metoxy-1,4-benzoquinol methylase
LSLVPPSTRLLDVGCGQGQFLKSVAVHRSPVALASLEIDGGLIQIARKELQTATTVPVKMEVYDGSQFPVYLADYDVISLVDVLHHISASDQRAFLENVLAGMRPGALLILKDIDARRAVLCVFNKLHDLVLSGEVPG